MNKTFLAMALAAMAPASFGAVITSAVCCGAVSPVTATFPTTVFNGAGTPVGTTPFTIVGNALAPLVGDGIDDTTIWAFNFNGPTLASFIANGPIISANFSLTVTPRGPQHGVQDDRVYIGNLSGGFIPAANPAFIGMQNTIPTLASLQTGVTTTVTANLLNFYSAAELMNLLQNGFGGSGGGIIPFLYHDDAVASYSQLDLTNSATTQQPGPIPEPSTMALMGVGLLGLLWSRRK